MKNRLVVVPVKSKQNAKAAAASSRLAAARIATGSGDLSVRAYVTGNAAGIHGGSRLKYGKRDRQAVRKEERQVFITTE